MDRLQIQRIALIYHEIPKWPHHDRLALIPGDCINLLPGSKFFHTLAIRYSGIPARAEA